MAGIDFTFEHWSVHMVPDRVAVVVLVVCCRVLSCCRAVVYFVWYGWCCGVCRASELSHLVEHDSDQLQMNIMGACRISHAKSQLSEVCSIDRCVVELVSLEASGAGRRE